MSTPRYLLLAGPPDQLDALQSHAAAITREACLHPVFHHPAARLFAARETVALDDGHGVVIGSVFASDGGCRNPCVFRR